MPKLPAISGKRLIAILKREGFEEVRQRGSHVSLAGGRFRTVAPPHDALSKGTLLAILDQCGLTRDDLLRLLHGEP